MLSVQRNWIRAASGIMVALAKAAFPLRKAVEPSVTARNAAILVTYA